MATANQLKTLLKKKGWTGKEVGKLLIASALNDIQNQGKTPLFSQAELENMENSLTTESDYLTYGVYRSLHGAIIASYNVANGISQQFWHGFYRYFNEIVSLQNEERALTSLDRTPLIMTESQYQRLKKQAEDKLRGYKASFYFILFHVLSTFLHGKEEVPKTIHDALEATKKINVNKISFSTSYNELMGLGYYSLPDGRRSDQMPTEEWAKLVLSETLKNKKDTLKEDGNTLPDSYIAYSVSTRFKLIELFFKGVNEVRNFVHEQTGKSLTCTDERLEDLINVIINETHLQFPQKNTFDSDENLTLLEDALGLSDVISEWHVYKDLPDGLTAYDLLELIEDSSFYAETNPREHLKTFSTEYPDLYKALKDYIEDKIPQARGLKPNQLYKDLITYGELADYGVAGYKSIIEPSDNQIVEVWTDNDNSTEGQTKRMRAVTEGIAILRNPALAELDKNGDYVEKKLKLIASENIFAVENQSTKIAHIQSYVHTLMYPALAFLYAYNSLMDIIGKVYDLPDLPKIAKFETDSCEIKMQTLNKLLYLLFDDVYGNEEEKKRKRRIIKRVFFQLNPDILKPSEETIEQVTEELTNMGFSSEARRKLHFLYTYQDRLINSRKEAL